MAIDSAVLVFDLDDTLYLESDFARSGFRAADDWLRNTMGIDRLAQRCEELFASGRRTRIFNEALDGLGLGGRDDIVAQLVDLYHNHAATISLAPDAARYLAGSVHRSRRAIISDGPAAMQMAKIRALGLENLVDYIICTDVWGQNFWKPHSRAFEAVETWSAADPAHMVYIADNPKKDFVTPRLRGWWTVRIARRDRIHMVDAPDPSHEAHATIDSLDRLDDCLAQLDAFWAEWRSETVDNAG